MSRFKLLYFVIFIINNCLTNAQISDKRLCADEECKVPISHAKTLLRYSSPDSRILSFLPNIDVTIYSKSAGSREDLWGAEINGKRGYVPKKLVREIKVLSKATYLVDTEFSNNTETTKVPSETKNENVLPDKVQEPYEVVDGTTIYLNPQDIQPSSTESPVQSTALPVSEEKQVETVDENKSDGNVKDNKDESVVDNVLSKFSNWINDDGNEDNDEDFDDEEDDDDDDEEDELSTEHDQESNESDNIKNNSEQKNENSNVEEPNANLLGVSAETVTEMADQTLKVTPFSADIENSKSADIKEEPKIVENVIASEAPSVPPPPENLSPIVESQEIPSINEELPPVVESIPAQQIIEESSTETTNSEANLPTVEKVVPLEAVEFKDPVNTDSIPSQNAKTVPVVETVNVENKKMESSPEDSMKNEHLVQRDSVLNTDSVTNETVDTKNETGTQPVESKQEEFIEEKSATPPSIEVTTLLPELEVPQPLPDILMNVTPDPVEAVPFSSSEEVEVSSMPPFDSSDVSGEKKNSDKDNELPIKDSVPIEILENTNDASLEQAHDSAEEENFEEEDESNEATGKKRGFLSGVISLFSRRGNSEETAEREPENEELQEETDVLESKSKEVEKPSSSPEEINREITTGQNVENFKFQEVNESSTPPEEINREINSGQIVENLKSEEVGTPSAPLKEINSGANFCNAQSCPKTQEEAPQQLEQTSEKGSIDMGFNLSSDFFLYLVTTAISVIIFLFGYIAFDKSKREGPLVAKINKLEKDLLILLKENQILQETSNGESGYDTNDHVSNEVVESLKEEVVQLNAIKSNLEEQVQSLEKELENSTEVGMELNRMLSEILSSQSGSDVIKANIENLQRQLVEQQGIINSVNETLAITNTENHELKLELELSNKKVLDLQAELDKMALNIMKIEEEKDIQQNTLESEIVVYRQKYQDVENKLLLQENQLSTELNALKSQLSQVERNLELKNKEFAVLTETLKKLKVVKNNEDTLKALLEVGEIKAELELLQTEKKQYMEKLQQEQEAKNIFEKKAKVASEESQKLRVLYDEADKLKVETQTKLEVLSNYFKEREAHLQKEISKHESLWEEKQGEATSTTERIKFMQEQLQNYKSQNESLKQEIVSQEVELKSQISVLEKKAHENWVSARQAERKLEDAKQEAAQLRHRLTLRERSIQEEKGHRLKSPVELNGDIPVSPIESPASPPLIFGGRDHITKSPPLPGLPPFLPPPPGVPFMPPPPIHGVPPFIPPPTMFPGDHRPPPLGRMSSPPINSRYSPSSRGYSPYDSSPSESEYGTSPPQRRGFSPYTGRNDRDDRKDYKRPPPLRSNGRNMKGTASSGSAHSNESLEKINRKHSKV